MALRIEERFRDEKVEPTAAEPAREKREYGYHAPRKVSVPTGALRIVRLDTYYTWGEADRRSWYDRKGKRVEDQISEFSWGSTNWLSRSRSVVRRPNAKLASGQSRSDAVRKGSYSECQPGAQRPAGA